MLEKFINRVLMEKRNVQMRKSYHPFGSFKQRFGGKYKYIS